MIGTFSRISIGIGVAGFAALNLAAYLHARAMMTIADSGSRTDSPQQLSPGQRLAVLLTGVRLPRPRNEATPENFGLDFTTHLFETGDHFRLEAWHIPRAEAKGTVLLVHGYASCKSNLLPEARAFHDLGYQAFLVDCRGSGGSSGNRTTAGLLESEDVARSADYLHRLNGEDRPLCYGVSMGGAAILRAVARHQLHPRGIILESVFDRMLSTVQHRFRAMGLPAFPAAQLLLFWASAQVGQSGFAHNPADYAQRVTCPTLVLQGTEDPWVGTNEAERIYLNLAGPKQLTWFPGARHESCLAAQPEKWKETVGQFLANR